MAKSKRTKAEKPNRKIGERVETIDVRLTPMQVEDARARVIDLLQEKDELEEKLTSIKAEYKAKIAEVDSRKAHELGMIRSGRTRKEITIEEWVTAQNEVIRLDKATGEEIGRRTASARELQEELDLEKDPAPPAKEGEEALEEEVAADVDKSEDDEDGFGDS